MSKASAVIGQTPLSSCWAGSAPLDPRRAGVSRRNNPYDISRFAGADGHGGAPEASGFDPDTGMGPGP